ncbi:hypothetical protein AGMMS49579_03840 [Spirochaetia bacterium]|nr:hypothetical protein AGMMS49579_03840 [Spirochaetia bacterium]
MLKLTVSEKIFNTCIKGKTSPYNGVEYFNELKQQVVCISTSGELSTCCFWDKQPFDNDKVIYCPIRYKPKQLIKHYESEISNEKYTIKENIPIHNTIQNTSEPEYEYDGKFCSISCCLAFIQDNKHDKLYDQSEMLLFKLYPSIVNPAPHWKLLDKFGGPLNIKEFRNSTESFKYKGYTLDHSTKCQKFLYHIYEKVINKYD